MGFLSEILEKRSVDLANPPRWFLDGFGGSTATGVHVTPDTAMQNSAVFACVRVLAESEASLPLLTYERLPNGGKRRAVNHALYPILHDLANPEMTSIEFRETMMSHVTLRGNGLAEIEFDNGGRVKNLWPLRPDRVQKLERVNGKLVYVYQLPTGKNVGLPFERVLHIKGLSSDGLWGMSPIRVAMEAVGLALATEEFGARFFGNGARPGAVYEHPGKLSEEAYKRLKTSFEMRHQGLSNAHRVAILEEGMKVNQIGVAPDEAQFLETRKFQVREIARLFRMQPHMIQDLDNATFSNIEHQSLEFVTHTLRPWLVKWEQAIYRDLLTPKDRAKFYVEHLVDGLLRGDIKSRYEAYSVGRQNGWLSADDIRTLENMNPLPDGQGEVYLVPLNMIPADQLTMAEPEDRALIQAETRGETRAAGQASLKRQRISGTYRTLIFDAAARVVNREIADIRRAAKKKMGNDRSRDATDDFGDWLMTFYDAHQAFFVRMILPVMLAFAEQTGVTVADEVGQDIDETDLKAFVTDYVNKLAAQHSAIGLQMVRNALAVALDELTDPVEAVELEVLTWEDNRANKLAMRESTGASGAVTRYLMAAAGITRIIWRSNGDTCPYCRKMDGKTVGIEVPFFAKGDEFNPPGADRPMTTRSDVFAPPLHSGCDCGLEASR